MSKLTTNRLWNAYFGKNKNIVVSGIEAPTAAEAEAEAMKNMKEPIAMLDSEPIYETSIGVELADSDVESENGIFEISIKGTDRAKVDELKKILAFLMNGAPCEFEYPDEENVSQSVWALRLRNFINENEMTVATL